MGNNTWMNELAQPCADAITRARTVDLRLAGLAASGHGRTGFVAAATGAVAFAGGHADRATAAIATPSIDVTGSTSGRPPV